VLGLLLTGALIALYVWMLIDCQRVMGTFYTIVFALLGFFLMPFIFIIIPVYLIMRNNRLANPPGDRNWQRDLNKSLKERQYSSRPATATSEGMISYADRDTEVETLAQNGDLAGAIRLARERAAEALDRRNYELAKVYESYLEKFRRGAK
jgi:hypothetical protein